MAKGGMGDLLAGFITGFAAQEIEPFKAACIGVYYHGKAGDIAKAVLGEYSLLPHDLETLLGKAIAHSFKA
jgi:NAD(P)H-hydrate epimerase